MKSPLQPILPAGWSRAKGFSYGMLARSGNILLIAGQLAVTDGTAAVPHGLSLAEQFALCLRNVVGVVRAAGGQPEDVAALRAFVTDMAAFKNAQSEIGTAWRATLGAHFPAMTLVEVSGLFETTAVVEIEGTAIIQEVSRS
jgi:enamine deaminase RidA (YjgF/YER057c/UK114 family)